MIFDCFIPTYTSESIFTIDYKYFFNKGYRGIIFDIDNTLVFHDALANDDIKNFINTLIKIGYTIMILSNNNKNRVKEFCNYLGIEYYIPNAKKPLSYNYHNVAIYSKIDEKRIICIGDQLLTDIYGANNACMTSILVNPLSSEIYFHIKLKRILEYIIKIIRKKDFVNKKI